MLSLLRRLHRGSLWHLHLLFAWAVLLRASSSDWGLWCFLLHRDASRCRELPASSVSWLTYCPQVKRFHANLNTVVEKAEQPLAWRSTAYKAVRCVCLKSGVFPPASWVRPMEVTLRSSSSDFSLDLHQMFNTTLHYILPILRWTLLSDKMLHSLLKLLLLWFNAFTVTRAQHVRPRVGGGAELHSVSWGHPMGGIPWGKPW